MNNICPTTGSYSEEHKKTCLVRTVRAMNPKRRKDFIAGYSKNHGIMAGVELKKLIDNHP